MQYRHEWKHVITWLDLMMIRQRLRAVADADAHAIDGKYLIRSLYFDTPGDRALREKIDGVNKREKFRIRYYNGDASLIHLEKKSKRNSLGTKFSAELTKEEAQAIVDGDYSWMAAELMKPESLTGDSKEPGSFQPRGKYRRELVAELYGKIAYQGLRPKTIVDYIREPYIYRPGNVRVTFDYNIRTGLQCIDFLDPDCPMVPAGDAPVLLEVKWDAFLPDIIRDCVQVQGRRVTAFSKYAQCRIYG